MTSFDTLGLSAQLLYSIKDAGFTCSFKAKGPKVRDELVKMMAAGSNATPATAKKDKV